MSTNFQIDAAHSSAGFSVKHMMISKVHGKFDQISGELVYDAARPENSKIKAVIQAASINTSDEKREGHLKSGDFFDVEKYPTLEFVSKNIIRDGDELKMTGDLKIHGVTKEVIFQVDGPSQEVKDPWGNLKIGASATAKIKRKDFGLEWNAALEAGGVLVGEDVTLSIDLQFLKQV